MSTWAFRCLLWYICVLLVQPQNRFLFLYPFHIADLTIGGAVILHTMSAMQENRPLLRAGPATIIGLLLLAAGMASQYVGALQISSRWGGNIDVLVKGVFVMILVEAMATSAQRVWAVAATMMLSTLWWIKGGLRLAAAGATYSHDRIMGPAVSLVENPNGFAYMLCVMIPIYLYFYQQSNNRYLRWGFLAVTISAVYIVFETGSRTGFLQLIVIGLFLLPKYFSQHKRALLVGAVAIIIVSSSVGKLNVERFKSIPQSIRSFLSNEEVDMGTLNQDQQSAMERRLKNKDTWRLIMAYPLFGVGMNPDESRFVYEYPFAGGQVHNELLMAGKQMGFIGISLYISLLVTLAKNGRRAQREVTHTWPAISDLGWTFKLQSVAFFVGGMFSPIPWNAVLFIMVASASALPRVLQDGGATGG